MAHVVAFMHAYNRRKKLEPSLRTADAVSGSRSVAALLARKVQDELPQLEALVLDDTGFPKQGKHSVGVSRQYSGTPGAAVSSRPRRR